MQRRLTSFLALCLLAQLSAAAGDILPADAGLDGGKGGHWGLKSDKDWGDGRWNGVQHGPFVSGAIVFPGGQAAKGIAISLGADRKASVCFDAQRVGFCAAWTGNFLRFGAMRFGLVEPPTADGTALFSLPAGDLWHGASGQYRGLYLNGSRVTLAYTVGGAEVLESAWQEGDAISRTLQVARGETELSYTLAGMDGKIATLTKIEGLDVALIKEGASVLAVGLSGAGARLQVREGRVLLNLPPRAKTVCVKSLLWRGPEAQLATFISVLKQTTPPGDLEALCKPAPGRWGEALVTKGNVSTDRKPYVIDTLSVPYDNPFKALLFCSGLDFLPNGDAIVSTLHGDVWRVGGIDESLQFVTWKRFATGLFQPMGVRVSGGRILVHGRDQITALHDLNNDGEADYYENFCNLLKTSPSAHDFSAGLESDAAGNLYYVDPFGLHRIAPDGKRHETLATGWRNPISLAVSAEGKAWVAPQEGDWTPASQICEARMGGYYGYPGPKITPERPLGYDAPMCYIPRLVDNSTGGIAWAPGKNWGPLSGQLLNLSFGRCSVQLILREHVGATAQGGVVPLPLHFQSGVLRGRARPQDGQFYLVGTQGWVTSAVMDGSLQRVRFTGAKLCLPLNVETLADGLRITFSDPLDRETAEDAESYSMEQWNYRYGKQYGSSDYSIAQPEVVGHDPVEITGAKLSADGRSVSLKIPKIQPAMQVRINYLLDDKDGQPVRGEIDYTINVLNKAATPP